MTNAQFVHICVYNYVLYVCLLLKQGLSYTICMYMCIYVCCVCVFTFETKSLS